jgi:DNA primase
MLEKLNTATPQERPRYAVRKGIEAVKGAIRIEDYARSVAALKTEGENLRGFCPVHKGESASFYVYTESQRWWCHRCNEGGDVIDLCQAVEGGEPWEAMFALAQRYHVELPQRPPGWHEWQDTKARIRQEMRRGLAKVYQRRLYRMLRDAEAQAEDDEALWDEMYQSAYLAATERVFG